jgi:DNA-binding transcriptional LysR family regulator
MSTPTPPPYAELIAAFELCSVLVSGPESVDRAGCRLRPRSSSRHTVSLTPAGRARLKEVEHLLTGVEQRVLNPLTREEERTLYTLLSRATESPTCADALDTSRACMEE